MPHLTSLYRDSLALLTDLYQVTMAYAYWKNGMAERRAVFHLTFRKPPFDSGFTLSCGLQSVIELLSSEWFRADDLAYLATLKGNDGNPLFEDEFLRYLDDVRFSCDVDAIPEGTVVFPHEPLVRVCGPLIQAQILETPLLNLINFETLIATKAARICLATQGEPVLEFGLRRAQGVDGGVTASRAAFVGGCSATSNLLAGKLFGIPVKGTHAHSWVMCFDTELEAFDAYARAMPNNCVFLVDTYNTLDGVRHAVEAGRRLRARGHELAGVRLDSGDLAYLSVEARKILDQGGFPDAAILASNDLDEHIIADLKRQGAAIHVWGVGTRLATAYDQPALGGVYKLSAVAEPGGPWQYKVKLSEQAVKVSTPGVLQVRRFFRGPEAVADAIFNVEAAPAGGWTIVDPLDVTRRKRIDPGLEHEDLLVPVYRQGALRYTAPTLIDVRERGRAQLAFFHDGIKRFMNPHQFPVGLELGLHDMKMKLIFEARGISRWAPDDPAREPEGSTP